LNQFFEEFQKHNTTYIDGYFGLGDVFENIICHFVFFFLLLDPN
jgi:hypothetical protein